MEFRDLKRQYNHNKETIDKAIQSVIDSSAFIHGREVQLLENELADYVGVDNCITCANGTDALQIALMAWGIGPGDAVFVPDFTFFSSGEVVSALGAIPVFVDVKKDTYNIDPEALIRQINNLLEKGILKPKAVIAVDLFGLPAEFDAIKSICSEYNLYLLEDGAQGFGGTYKEKRACSFGDISTTSFFPAKPLGCYGDGGAIFTNNGDWANLIRSLCVHGKGESKYDNVRIGMNSRLDTIQAAILRAKLPIFINEELETEQKAADYYTKLLGGFVTTPIIPSGYYSSWAQYTIRLKDFNERNGLQLFLKERGIPSMVYYQKPMHKQSAFSLDEYSESDYPITNSLCETVLSLPFHPYIGFDEIDMIVSSLKEFLLSG